MSRDPRRDDDDLAFTTAEIISYVAMIATGVLLAALLLWLAAGCVPKPPVPPPTPPTSRESRTEAVHLGIAGCAVTLAQNGAVVEQVVTDVGSSGIPSDLTPVVTRQTVDHVVTDASGTAAFVVAMTYTDGQPDPGVLNLAAAATCAGYQPWVASWVAAVHGNQDVCAGGSTCGPNQGLVVAGLVTAWPQPTTQAPLTLEGTDPAGYPCHTAPITALPSTPDVAVWRSDAWGVTVPGLPFVYQGSSKHPERALTWFFDRWSPTWQRAILNAYRMRGYTHFVLSWPDSRDHGGIDNRGQSPAQFVQTALTIKQAIPYVAVFLTSKDDDPLNADAPTRMAGVQAAVDALVAAHAVDVLVVGWELNLFNDPVLLQHFIDALHARYPSLPLYVHFSTYYTAWQPNGQGRAQFWTRNRGELTGLLYQGNPWDSCGLMQAHFNDALDQASGLNGFVVVPWELVAAAEFDGDHPTEAEAAARGWAVLNTPGLISPSGFGNGAWWPSGAPLLGREP